MVALYRDIPNSKISDTRKSNQSGAAIGQVAGFIFRRLPVCRQVSGAKIIIFIEIRDFFNFYEISCSVLIPFYVIAAINRFKTIG